MNVSTVGFIRRVDDTYVYMEISMSDRVRTKSIELDTIYNISPFIKEDQII